MDDDDKKLLVSKRMGKCKLLVRTLNKKSGVEFNFHLIDLEKGDIELNYIPAIPMMEGAAIGKMAAVLESESDYCIYILGNRTSSKYSFFSKRWDAFDVPLETNYCSIPATISGKLYCFGVPGRPPMVYENGWKDLELLPHHLIDRKVSFPVLPDRINNRFLVHFFDSGEIYAFYPKSDATANTKWICVVDHLNIRWSRTMAVSGNILFVHVFMLPYLVIAYDMSTNKWLEIVADFPRVDETLSLFDDMFTLPENHDVLCLVSRQRRTRTDHTAVEIHRLSFRHTIGSNHLILTSLDSHSYIIPISSTVYEFLLL